MKKKVLITGGAGFVGSHLADRLLKEGYQVVVMDNLLTGRIQNIEHLFGNPDFVFVQHDITNYVHVPGELHYIYHFASPASPADYLRLPIQTLKVGSLGTHKILGLARAKGARVLIASTSEIYGDPLVHPQTEDYWGNVNPIGLRGVYDEAKRFMEAMTMAYHRYHQVEVRIARIFNTYGPRMRLNDGRALPNFLRQVFSGKPMTIYGDGMQTRSFCYVDDLVEGMIRLMFTEGIEGPVNLGNPTEITILQFAQEIAELMEVESRIEFLPPMADDPKVRQPDITRARTLLGWEPQVERREGLRRTIEYFKNNLHADHLA